MKIEKKKLQKYLVYSGIIMACSLMIFFVLSADFKKTEVDSSMVNSELPDPENEELPGNKRDIYEELEYQKFIISTLDGGEEEIDLGELNTYVTPENMLAGKPSEMASRNANIHNAHSAVSELNTTITASQSSENYAVVEEFDRKIEELQMQLIQQEAELKKRDAQAQLLQSTMMTTPSQFEATVENQSDKVLAVAIAENKSVVSSLNRTSFFGSQDFNKEKKNTIKASIYGRQIVMDNQNVKIRLTEPMSVGGHILPKGSIIAGRCQIGLDRLFISINSIEQQGVIMAVNLAVYDKDGQQGLYMPNNLENEILKEIGMDISNSVASATSSSMSVFSATPNAGEQIKTDLGRGTISGASNFINRKLSEVKVIIQDNHQLYLVTTIN